jgi:hypothetical protein
MVAAYDNMFLKYEFEDDDCSGDLGLVKFWPQHSSLQGEKQVYNGDAMGPPSVTPLRRPLVTGGKNSSEQVNVKVETGKAVMVAGDPLAPVPEGVESVILPVQVIVYGQPECSVKCMPACLLPNGQIAVRPIG